MSENYYGQFELDKVLNENLFNNAIGGYFMECGAYDGIEESTCYFFEKELIWTGINIEPLPSAFEKLVLNRPNSMNLNVALSDKEYKGIFYQPVHPDRGIHWGNGSLKHTKKHTQELISQGVRDIIQYEVHCISYAYLYFSGKLSRIIDLFVLDVEGHELRVLDGMFRLSFDLLPRFCCIEHTLCGYDRLLEKMTIHNYEMLFKYKHNTIFRKKKNGIVY